MKNRPVGVEVFHVDETERRTDGQTDMTEMIVAFQNFANSPEKSTTQCSPMWQLAPFYTRGEINFMRLNTSTN